MKYQQAQEIGRGGIGVVYKAFSQELDRWVAVKKLNPALVLDPFFKNQLEKEAFILSQLKHPHIVPFLKYDRMESEPCLVMEYVEAVHLKEWIKIHGPLSFEKVEPIFLAISGALEYLHQKGILHLDLKPENILITSQENIFVSDFGIAAMKGHQGNTTPIVDPMGSIEYMAPEQIKGEQPDGRSDLYSLGMILYTLLYGKGYFEGFEKVFIWGHLVYDSSPLSITFPKKVPLFFQNIIRRLVAKSPFERYPDIEIVLLEFNQYQIDHERVLESPRLLQEKTFSVDKTGNLISEKIMVFAAGIIVAFLFFYTDYTESKRNHFAPKLHAGLNPAIEVIHPPPEQKENVDNFEHQILPGKEPVIQISLLKRETNKPLISSNNGSSLVQLIESADAKTLDDQDLEEFLIKFKQQVGNKNLKALQETIHFAPAQLSLFKQLFQDYASIGIEFQQISREGNSISAFYRFNPIKDAMGNQVELALHPSHRTLLFREGEWRG